MISALPTDKNNKRQLTDLASSEGFRSEQVSNRGASNARKPAEPIGTSDAMRSLRKALKLVGKSSITVLVTGETGCGKEVVARRLHSLSPRHKRPFVAVNCAAMSAELLESELFGHEKGAFTGAQATHRGRFERADGGTLFLDEIGDMPMPMQVKLLRALQERTIERVGGTREIPVDVRVIAATHRDLGDAMVKGDFREDLYYRLSVFPLRIPALRERTEDLEELIQALSQRMLSEGRAGVSFAPSAIACLRRHHWPGNVRELFNLLEQMSVLYPEQQVDESRLPRRFGKQHHAKPTVAPVRDRLSNDLLLGAVATEVDEQPLLTEGGIDLPGFLRDQETTLIIQALRLTSGVVARAATLLNVRRTTLVEKMRKFGIDRSCDAATSNSH